MRPQTITQTGIGATACLPLELYISPFNVGFGVVCSGTPTFSVQHTFDDIYAANFNPATATWFDHPTVVNVAEDIDGNYAFPVRAVRLKVTGVINPTDSATLTVLQAGTP